MPSNLMPTIHEWVYLVRRDHFWSHDKDGGHTTQSAIAKNPMLPASFMAPSYTEPKLLRTRMYKVLKKYTDFLLAANAAGGRH